MIFFKKIICNAEDVIRKHHLEEQGRVQKYIDSEAIRLMEQYTPFDTGTLIKSVQVQSKIGSGKLVQRTPYARRWYYTPARFNGAPMRGNRWFEKMKINHKDDILKGAKRVAK